MYRCVPWCPTFGECLLIQSLQGIRRHSLSTGESLLLRNASDGPEAVWRQPRGCRTSRREVCAAKCPHARGPRRAEKIVSIFFWPCDDQIRTPGGREKSSQFFFARLVESKYEDPESVPASGEFHHAAILLFACGDKMCVTKNGGYGYGTPHMPHCTPRVFPHF